MISKPFDMRESNSYDNLTDEKLNYCLKNPEVVDLSKEKLHYEYSLDKRNYDSAKQVKIRLLCPFVVNFNTKNKVAQPE